MSAHPLTAFVYENFGKQFGDLLLLGYGAEPSGRRRRLYINESEAGAETKWVIEFAARHQPCRDEPLVLAALLKLLLSRANVSHYLEFELGELLIELQWQDESNILQQVETAIVGYVRLLYDKQANAQERRRMPREEGGGCYHLLTGYVRGDESAPSGTLDRGRRGVYFDAEFVRALRRGRVYFAGIDFGPLQTAE